MIAAVDIIPVVIMPLTFLFVLLVILVAKAPRVGAWTIGGLVLAAAALFWRLTTTVGPPSGGELIPLIVVPTTFLFVLLVILVARAPKAGAGLIVAIVTMFVLGLFLVPALSHRRATHTSTSPTGLFVESKSRGQGTSLVIVRDDGSELIEQGTGLAIVEDGESMSPVLPEPGFPPPPPPRPVVPSPIWSEGVEQEFEADIYPSKRAAVRAAGSQMGRPMRELTGDANQPDRIVLFQEDRERSLLVELRNAVQRMLPGAVCTIEAELRNIRPDEVGVTLRFVDTNTEPAPWASSSKAVVSSGAAEVNLHRAGRQVSVQTRYTEKPWMENFAEFANARPEQHFIIARSTGTCTSESEANQQALDDARVRLMEMLGDRERGRLRNLPPLTVTTTDVDKGKFIADRFAQSFHGSAGPIWRQALLIDISAAKLTRLATEKAHEARAVRMSWARMGLSIVGVLALIAVIYFFLNMATMGYYEWSLRIAGVVLAIVAIVSILMIVQ